jgi:hypothetical protein
LVSCSASFFPNLAVVLVSWESAGDGKDWQDVCGLYMFQIAEMGLSAIGPWYVTSWPNSAADETRLGLAEL